MNSNTIQTNLKITPGYWVQLPTNSCNIYEQTMDQQHNVSLLAHGAAESLIHSESDVIEQFCVGYPLYDESMKSFTVYTLPHCHFEIFQSSSERLYQCLKNRPLLFLGDSTMENTVGPSLIKYYLNDTTWTQSRRFSLIENITNNIEIYFHFDGAYKLSLNHMGLTSFNYQNYTFFNDTLDPLYFKNNQTCITEIVFVSVCFLSRVL